VNGECLKGFRPRTGWNDDIELPRYLPFPRCRLRTSISPSMPPASNHGDPGSGIAGPPSLTAGDNSAATIDKDAAIDNNAPAVGKKKTPSAGLAPRAARRKPSLPGKCR
jgi:hypothetical protein